MKDFDEKQEKTPFIYIIAMIMVFIISLGLVLISEYQKRELELKLSEEVFYVVEGEVIYVSEDGLTLYCLSDYTPEGYVVEVDVYDEMLCDCFYRSGHYCKIKAGDKVIFSVDVNWQDADCIGKIHEK